MILRPAAGESFSMSRAVRLVAEAVAAVGAGESVKTVLELFIMPVGTAGEVWQTVEDIGELPASKLVSAPAENDCDAAEELPAAFVLSVEPPVKR